MINIDNPTKGACNLGSCTKNKDDKVPNHMQDHDESSERSYRDKTNRKGCPALETVLLNYEDIDQRVREESSREF